MALHTNGRRTPQAVHRKRASVVRSVYRWERWRGAELLAVAVAAGTPSGGCVQIGGDAAGCA
jgi:hypothetical protein